MTRVGIQPNTRLWALVRGCYANKRGWMAWIAVDPRRLRFTPDKWYGTYLFMADDGSVLRVTVDQEDEERVMEIKDAEEES